MSSKPSSWHVVVDRQAMFWPNQHKFRGKHCPLVTWILHKYLFRPILFWRHIVSILHTGHKTDQTRKDMHWVLPNITNTFLKLSLHSEQPQFVRAWTRCQGKVSKAFPRDAGPCWLQCFPQLCHIGRWTILDTDRKLLSVKNPAVLQLLTQTGAPGTYYYSLFKGT
jgi:hypothetical protein